MMGSGLSTDNSLSIASDYPHAVHKEARPAEAGRVRYRADLDGLRALAVGGVLLSHATLPNPLPAGVVGVTAFFVLSGYLITSLLLGEKAATGRVKLRAFYGRRIRRLGPALVVVLAFVVVTGVAGLWRSPWIPGVAGAVGYVSNWFAVGGITLGPLAHAWSLSIEEQFYLVWPLLALGGRRVLIIVAVLGIALAVVLRTFTDSPTTYYSTFTRMDAILAGSLLALVPLRFPSWAGTLGLATLVMVALVPLDFAVGLPFATVAAVVTVAGGVPWLRHLAPLGKRAYGIYLWNWPLTLLVGPLAAPLSIIAAEVSWRTIEARFSSRRKLLRSRDRVVALVVEPQHAR